MTLQRRNGILSVVLSAYNEEDNIENAVMNIHKTLSANSIDHSIVIVNDGSTDNTWEEAVSVVGSGGIAISLSRNFGKEAAILAGLSETSYSACVAVMDCDLQHPPETLVEMYRLWQDGYDIIEGIKKERGRESRFHHKGASLFYRLMSKATKQDMTNTSDFKLLDRKAVDAILSMPERHTFFRAMSAWVGFRTARVEYDVLERSNGESKWSNQALFSYAIDNIIEYSTLPMQFVTLAGIIFFVFALAMGIETLVVYFEGKAATGFSIVVQLSRQKHLAFLMNPLLVDKWRGEEGAPSSPLIYQAALAASRSIAGRYRDAGVS